MRLPIRESARAIIVDPDNRVLLMQIKPDFAIDPKRPELVAYWITPGGGVRDGERIEAAIVRELAEETGFCDLAPGPFIHSLDQELMWKGELTIIRDHYFLVRAPQTDLSIDQMEEEERSIFQGYRWWPVCDLRAASFDLRPETLKELIPHWLGLR